MRAILSGALVEKNVSLNDSQSTRSAEKWGVFALIIFIFGTIFGNILVLMAVYFETRLRNINNYFLMSLAVNDLLVAVLVMPIGLLVEINGYFPLHWVVCSVWCTMDVFLCTASIWHMAIISMDRLLSLQYPLSFGRNKTIRAVVAKIIGTWTLAILIGGGTLIMSLMDSHSVFNDGTCAITNEHFMIYGSIVAFLMPAAIMLITYALTHRLLAKNQFSRESNLSRSSVSNDHVQPEKKASKVLGIVVLVFCCLWSPFFVANIILATPCEECKANLTKGVTSAFLWLGYISSMANPIIYTIFNLRFRETFKNILTCQVCHRQERSRPSAVAGRHNLQSTRL